MESTKYVEITEQDLAAYSKEQAMPVGGPSLTKRIIIDEYWERQHFYDCFIKSLVVVDPLDRIDPELYP